MAPFRLGSVDVISAPFGNCNCRCWCAAGQRCHLHYKRTLLADAEKSARSVVAFVATAFAWGGGRAGHGAMGPGGVGCRPHPQADSPHRWRSSRPMAPVTRTDVSTFMGLPEDHHTKLLDAGSIQRANAEIRRATDLDGCADDPIGCASPFGCRIPALTVIARPAAVAGQATRSRSGAIKLRSDISAARHQ